MKRKVIVVFQLRLGKVFGQQDAGVELLPMNTDGPNNTIGKPIADLSVRDKNIIRSLRGDGRLRKIFIVDAGGDRGRQQRRTQRMDSVG